MRERISTDSSNSNHEILTAEQSFRIRGHHLGQFGMLLLFYTGDPEKLAELSAKAQKHKRKYSKSKDRVSDATDVVGSTPIGAWRFTRNLTQLYREFLSLPKDALVDVVEGEKDEICNRCIMRKDRHCIERYPNSTPDYDNLESDRSYVDRFVETARRLGTENIVNIEESLATFSDSIPEPVRLIKTKAGNAKAIILALAIEDCEAITTKRV